MAVVNSPQMIPDLTITRQVLTPAEICKPVHADGVGKYSDHFYHWKFEICDCWLGGFLATPFNIKGHFNSPENETRN